MKKKIMVIEDDPAVADYLVTLFEDNGYAASLATNVKDGYDIAKKEHPDLITLDLELPDEWGPSFFKKMTLDKELKNTPVIVISGLPGNQYAISKAAATLSKPFDRDELLKIVKANIL
jgi:DNA-binding response OmpR family regulator